MHGAGFGEEAAKRRCYKRALKTANGQQKVDVKLPVMLCAKRGSVQWEREQFWNGAKGPTWHWGKII